MGEIWNLKFIAIDIQLHDEITQMNVKFDAFFESSFEVWAKIIIIFIGLIHLLLNVNVSVSVFFILRSACTYIKIRNN